MYEKVYSCYLCLIVLTFLNFSIFITGQVLRNSYPGTLNEERRRLPYPNDYYDRYPARGNPKFTPTGIDSDFGDKRCVGEGNSDFNLNLERVATVKTRLGDIQGTYLYLCDGPGIPEFDRQHLHPTNKKIYRNITLFLGIPYATAPTKENGLRFRPPQYPSSFNSIQALQYKSACPQQVIYYGEDKGVAQTDEDCLYLNVFSPSVSRRSQTEKYAVMIYIHGGDWDHGNSNSFPAQMLSASQEVIVVTFNYRLGPLGFFSTADNSSAGNYGLLDQAMAIEWVFDNIDAFNGDPQRLTLFGPGVGAASAGILALSERLGNKIRRVIAQSGSAVADWATISDPYLVYNNSLEFATELNCQFPTSWRIVECLRAQNVIDLQRIKFKPKMGWKPWGPVVDVCSREPNRRILPDLPAALLEYGLSYLHPDFAYMSGVTKDEALADILTEPKFRYDNYVVNHEAFQAKVKEFAPMFNYSLDLTALTKAINFMYMPREKDADNLTLLTEGYINMLSDSYYKAPNDKMLKLLLKRDVKTYMYVLNCTAEGLRTIRNRDQNLFKWRIPHDSEYFYITGAPFMDANLYPRYFNLYEATWTEADRNMSQFFMTAWANFAKFGNPTPVPLFETILWTPMKLNDMQYLSVNTTNFTTVMMSNYHQKESQFWNVFIRNIMKPGLFVNPLCRPIYEKWQDQKFIYEASLWGVVGAVGLFLILSILCCCLYCKAKSKHIVSTEDIPDAISVTPSSIDTLLSLKKEARNRFLPENFAMETKHTTV